MIGVLAPSSRAQAVAKDNATPPSPSTPFQSFTNVSSDRSRFITKDWQVSPIISMFTGNPIQITGGKNISLSGQNLDRPNVILPDQVYGAPKTVLQYLNPAAFQCAGSNSACTVFSGQFGHLGRNSLYGSGKRNFDIAVSNDKISLARSIEGVAPEIAELAAKNRAGRVGT